MKLFFGNFFIQRERNSKGSDDFWLGYEDDDTVNRRRITKDVYNAIRIMIKDNERK